VALTDEQINVLLLPIKPGRVHQVEGMSHVEGYDIRAMLIRVFGFGGWDEIALESTDLLYEQPTQTRAGKDAFKVAYRASRRLVVRDPEGNVVGCYDGSAVGEAIMPDFKRGDAHDMAIKTAETQAHKRAAINLGDQFGLSLYRKGGSSAPLVRKVVGHERNVVAHPDPDPTPRPAPTSERKPASKAQVGKIKGEYKKLGVEDRADQLTRTSDLLGFNVTSHNELTTDDAASLIEALVRTNDGASE